MNKRKVLYEITIFVSRILIFLFLFLFLFNLMDSVGNIKGIVLPFGIMFIILVITIAIASMSTCTKNPFKKETWFAFGIFIAGFFISSIIGCLYLLFIEQIELSFSLQISVVTPLFYLVIFPINLFIPEKYNLGERLRERLKVNK